MAAAGDRLAVLPVLFHLLWRHDLAADLATRLGLSTLVYRTRALLGLIMIMIDIANANIKSD